LGLLELLDLIFPIIGVWAVWRFKYSEKDPDDERCFKTKGLFLMYWAWAIIFVIIAIIFLLVRAGEIAISSNNSEVAAFFGIGSNGETDWVPMGLSIAEIILQFFGFVYGVFLFKVSLVEGKSKNAGFV